MTTGDRADVGAGAALDQRFEAVVLFTDRATADLRPALVGLLDADVHLAVITAGPAAAVVEALPVSARAEGVLLVAGRHGAEIVVRGRDGGEWLPAGPDGDAVEALRTAAATVVQELASLGVEARASSPSEYERDVVIDVAPLARKSLDDPDDVGELVAYGRSTSTSSLRQVATRAAVGAGIADPRVWTDDARVEIAMVDEGDALAHSLAGLWDEGVSSSGVLVLADEGDAGARGCARTAATDSGAATVACATAHVHHGHPGTISLTGGGRDVLDVLLDQVRRRAARSLPSVVPEPGWGVRVDGLDPALGRVHEALFVLADGEIGVRGALTGESDCQTCSVLAAGVYDLDGASTHLLPGPFPARFDGTPDRVGSARTLDLRSGVVAEVASTERGSVEAVRFASLRRPGVLVERVSSPPALDPRAPLSPPSDGRAVDQGWTGAVQWMQVPASTGGIAAASSAGRDAESGAAVYERFTAFGGEPEALPDLGTSVRRAVAGREDGFDRLLGEHRAGWAERWRDADVVVDGDERLQTALRLALFHVMASVRDHGEAAVGARGLTGPSYRGHVFWDADTFVLPFLAATHPESARAMLEYRVRRLPAAHANARTLGRQGARFPWESARSGLDVTPTSARDRAGRLIPIRTGLLEDHIVADVAWASSWYEEWTGDDAYRRTDGLRILVDSARFWASRIRVEPDGRAHIYGVVGPDEYHEPVDDDAFTNVMARWNLRRAAAAVDALGDDSTSPEERGRWLELAGSLVDGYDPDTGIYEQCADFFSFEPLIIAEVAPRRPIAADYLLGIDRIRRAQVVKQADVLMLHHLVPEEVVRGTLEPNLRYYEPRTAHGSSLSPAIHAALFARARDFERALDALRIASRIDLDDLTGTTAGGLHLATMGGLWQALVMGFAGLRPRGGQLHVDPLLPRSWSALEVHVRFLGSRLTVRRERAQMTISAESPVDVVVDDRAYSVGGRGLVFVRRYDTWGLMP